MGKSAINYDPRIPAMISTSLFRYNYPDLTVTPNVEKLTPSDLSLFQTVNSKLVFTTNNPLLTYYVS